MFSNIVVSFDFLIRLLSLSMLMFNGISSRPVSAGNTAQTAAVLVLVY
jgi:hypothetical protein